MASSPTYDPNLVEDDFAPVLQTPGACAPGRRALLNRATQGLFIPGSTFKVVTAAAALESGSVHARDASSTTPASASCTASGSSTTPTRAAQRSSAASRSPRRSQNSINSVFCDIGKELGPQAILEQARAVRLLRDAARSRRPRTSASASGLYRRGELFFPSDPNAVDPGRLAFGQERLLATPLQMAMVAAGVANGGIVMRPFVVDRILKPDGSILTKTQPEELSPGSQPGRRRPS